MYTQPTADGVFMLPGANGGEEWSPIAVHPDLAYAYTVGLHQPMHYKVHYAPWEKGRLWLGSALDRKSTRLNSSHSQISYAVFCLKNKKTKAPSLRLSPFSCPSFR